MLYLAHKAHKVPVLPCAGSVDGGVAHQLRVHLDRGVEAYSAFLTQTENANKKDNKEEERSIINILRLLSIADCSTEAGKVAQVAANTNSSDRDRQLLANENKAR